jgi:hypothetical protein
VIGPVDLAVPASGNVSAIAHLGADGTPTITPFVNDTAPAAAGSGRVVVRHTAAAPAVDVLVGGTPALTNLTNPNEQSAELPVGTVSATVAATGTTEPVIGPADVPVVAGQATIVYAIGSLEDSTLDVLVQTVALDGGAGAAAGAGAGGEAPAGVPARLRRPGSTPPASRWPSCWPAASGSQSLRPVASRSPASAASSSRPPTVRRGP